MSLCLETCCVLCHRSLPRAINLYPLKTVAATLPVVWCLICSFSLQIVCDAYVHTYSCIYKIAFQLTSYISSKLYWNMHRSIYIICVGAWSWRYTNQGFDYPMVEATFTRTATNVIFSIQIFGCLEEWIPNYLVIFLSMQKY